MLRAGLITCAALLSLWLPSSPSWASSTPTDPASATVEPVPTETVTVTAEPTETATVVLEPTETATVVVTEQAAPDSPPCGSDAESACFSTVVASDDQSEWLLVVVTALGLLVFLGFVHVVGSWRK